MLTIVITVIITIYILFGCFISAFENVLNGGSDIEFFDIFNAIFWLPLAFFDKEKIYKKFYKNDRKRI